MREKSGFGRRLVQLRSERSMTQTDLSQGLQRIGLAMTQGAISKIEKRGTAPDGDIVAGLARLLGTSTDYLLGLRDDPAPMEEAILYFSREADEVARMTDAMTPEMREVMASGIRAAARMESIRREENARRWRQLMAQVEALVGPEARREIESSLISGQAGGEDRKVWNAAALPQGERSSA